MRGLYRSLLLVTFVVFAVSFASGQAATGTPPWSSLEGGPDVVNLGNLNIHMVFPVFHKAGRQLALSYDLTNDSSFWFPLTSGSTTQWDGFSALGWSGSSQGVGFLYSDKVSDGFGGFVWDNFDYVDSSGTNHFFGSLCFDQNGIVCPQSGSATTVDGSGYTLAGVTCPGCNLTLSLTSVDGSGIVPQNGLPLNPTVVAGSVIDRNGNEISTDTTGSVFDTLSSTVKAITASGGNPNPYVLGYTSPAGAAANVTTTFKPYTLKTNFGCPGISELGPLADNLVDKITLPDGTFYQFTYEATPGFPSDVTGRLASIKLPTGGTISYNYSVGTHNGIMCSDGSASGVRRTTPDGTWTYTRTGGTGAASTTTVVDPKGNNTVIQFQGGIEVQRQTYQGAVAAANLLQTINACYNGAASPCTGTAIALPVTSKTVTTQMGTATSNVQAKKVYTYNAYGLPTEEDDYDFTGTLPLKKVIISYATGLGAIVDKPKTVTVTDGSGNTVSSVTYGYDETAAVGTTGTPQHAAVTGSRGNQTSIAVSANASTTLYRKFTYFDTGNMQTSTEASTSSTSPGATTTYNYAAGTASCGNSFVTSVSEPLSLSRSMTWNCTGGVETSATDENGAVTHSTYTDSFFWRPSQTQDALLNPTNYTYTGATVSEATLPVNGGTTSAVDILSTLDTQGRQYLTQIKQSPTATNYDTTETDYDSVGLALHQRLPFVSTAGTPNASAPGTTTTYDGLNRQILASDSGGGTLAYTYNRNDVLITAGPAPTGENTKRRQLEYDALGRLTSVCELTITTGSGSCAQTNAQTGFWTKYTYDANSNRTGVTQNAQAVVGSQQTRSYTYDRINRLTSETNPESATTQYFYDTAPSSPGVACAGTYAGQLVKKYDANTNTTCSTYDVLHRLLSKTYSGPNSTGVNKYFVYDAATVGGVVVANAKTRIAEAYTATCQTCGKVTDEGFSYTKRGELANYLESTPNSAGYYSVPMSYWENGVMKSFGPFLNEDSLGFAVDGEGRTLDVHSLVHASTPVSGITYNTASQPTGLNTACNPTCSQISYLYDPNTLRMTQYSVPLTNGLLSGKPTWNPNGSLQKLVVSDPANPPDSQTCTYSADDLGRLASVNCGSTWAQTFGYDPLGNITKSGSLVWNPGYTTSTNHYASGSGSTYDTNGNLTSDGSNTYTWDAEGKPLSTSGPITGGNTWQFLYDAFGHKAEWAVNGTYRDSFVTLGKFKMMAAGQTADYSEYPLPGGSVYSVNGGATGYQIADWQGTIRAFYTLGGTLSSSGAHAPFGEYYSSLGNVLGYTGQTSLHDDKINGTYYFPERDYRAGQGRWLSPDPAGMGAVDPTDPQSWNRYAYVGNSPLNRIDPQGTDWGDGDWGGGDWGGGWGGGDWGGDWGGGGGGGGGTISISINIGPNGVSVGGGIGINGGGCFGVPCDTRFADELKQIAQAIKDKNWGALVGVLANQESQNLWAQVPDPAIMNEKYNDGIHDCRKGQISTQFNPCFTGPDAQEIALLKDFLKCVGNKGFKESVLGAAGGSLGHFVWHLPGGGVELTPEILAAAARAAIRVAPEAALGGLLVGAWYGAYECGMEMK